MIILSIRLFFLAARETNPEGLPFFINPSVLTGTSPIFYDAKHPVRLRGTAREDCDTKNFLSQPKKVLVTLIRFICSFFSTARRTNQEAPPQLSGFWVRRYGRRRGLRNSLRSDSPRPFPSVFLATSPPDKGGIGGLACILTPSPFGHSPYIPLRKHPVMLRGTAGERVRCISLSLLLRFYMPHPVMLRGTAREVFGSNLFFFFL